jgi:mono/diheme cytochrome c family protein
MISGVASGRWVDHIPVRVDRRLVDTGRARFDTFCAACHGIQGDGVSVVAEKMALRKPANLTDARVRAFPPGRIFQTIEKGYGLMPSYADQVSVDEAWGVTVYVRALQLAAGAPVSDLPPDIRGELLKEAP